ncbi:MAG: hypothetical protein IRZ00_18445, partial [Gemmatimonadetes bacterium]|nr:hypothetical protein [Gemmatimonadota bacterium]
MFLYLDSVFAEARERVVRPLHTIPPTLAQLYQLAMREHLREGVLRWWSGGRWEVMPDWRFDRRVIRLALVLRERFEVQPGDVVYLGGALRPELIVAELAVTSLGAVALMADAALGGADLVEGLGAEAPKAALCPAAAWATPGFADVVPAGRAIALDAGAPPEAVAYGAALDLGGTLDTPERASALRAAARELAPTQPALRQLQRTPGGGLVVSDLSHGEVVAWARGHWEIEPAARGDVVYLAERAPSLTLRALVYAFIGDGHSTIALATPGREAAELRELRPGKVVAPAAVLAAVLARPSGPGGPG